MEQDDIELHTLAGEIADLDELEYADALERARQQLGAVQQYAYAWDECAAYLEVLATLRRGERPTAAQFAALMTEDHVVTYCATACAVGSCHRHITPPAPSDAGGALHTAYRRRCSVQSSTTRSVWASTTGPAHAHAAWANVN